MIYYGVIFGLAVIVGSLLRAFWWGVGIGLLIDLVVFLFLQYGSTIKGWIPNRTGRVTTAEKKSWLSWLIALIALAVVTWSWYSIDREVGFPGTWLAKKNYVETFDITVVDFRDQPPICAPQINLPEGQKIKFGFLNPDRDNNLGEVKAEVEGAPTINLASIMRLNRTTRHLAFRPVGKCLIVDWTGIPPEYKDLRLKRGLTVTVLLQAAN